MKNPPGYDTWYKMRDRCYNSKNIGYKDYGGRGITVCEAWLTGGHVQFLKDMGYRPPGTTVERLDNNSGYTPDNCVWGTKRQQARNRRNVRYVTIGGKTHSAIELSDTCGLDPDVIVARAARGLTFEEVTSKAKQANPINQQIATRAATIAKLAKTHCKHGHAWTVENTRISKIGKRECRACGRAYQLKLRQRSTLCGTSSN